MRDSDIIERREDPAGFIFEHVRTSADVLAEFPFLSPTRWSCRHPNAAITLMGTGATEGEAFARLLNNCPHLAERNAA